MMSVDELLLPLESAEFVMSHAKSVQILPEGIDALAEKVQTNCSVLLSVKNFEGFFINKLDLHKTARQKL